MSKPIAAGFIDLDNLYWGSVGRSTEEKLAELQLNLSLLQKDFHRRWQLRAGFAYGRFNLPNCPESFCRVLPEAIIPLFTAAEFMVSRTQSKTADIELVADLIDFSWQDKRCQNFVLVTGDGDFCYPVKLLKERNRRVYGYGFRLSTSAELRESCTEFVTFEDLLRDHHAVQPSIRRLVSMVQDLELNYPWPNRYIGRELLTGQLKDAGLSPLTVEQFVDQAVEKLILKVVEGEYHYRYVSSWDDCEHFESRSVERYTLNRGHPSVIQLLRSSNK